MPKPHHTLLHTETTGTDNSTLSTVPSLAASGMKTNSLLMTCRVIVSTPNGLYLQARAILNSALSASFISERLARSLHLLYTRHVTSITGIAGLTCGSTTHSVTTFSVSAVSSLSNQITITAVVIPKVTCDLLSTLFHMIPVGNISRESN